MQANPTLTIQYSTAPESRQDYEGAKMHFHSQNGTEPSLGAAAHGCNPPVFPRKIGRWGREDRARQGGTKLAQDVSPG